MARVTPITVYIGTSVFGGVFDEEFREASVAFLDQLERGLFTALTSPVVAAELRTAPTEVRTHFDRLGPICALVDVTEEALTLRDAYISGGVITARWSDDALHVALATVHDAELIVSWNFRHLVNTNRIRGYNGVNQLNG